MANRLPVSCLWAAPADGHKLLLASGSTSDAHERYCGPQFDVTQPLPYVVVEGGAILSITFAAPPHFSAFCSPLQHGANLRGIVGTQPQRKRGTGRAPRGRCPSSQPKR